MLRFCSARVSARAAACSVRRASAAAATGSHDLVGFVGLGIMGQGMARNLLKNGVPLLVWNRNGAKALTLQQEFPSLVTVADTPRDVASKSSTVVSMLSTPDALREVYTAPSTGLLAGVHRDTKLIECGTYEAADMEWASEAVRANGGGFLAAPVSGSKVPAETGTLVFITSGDASVSASGAPLLAMMGKSAHYLGSQPAAAANMKLIVNSMMASMLACLSEGLHQADAVGVPSDTLLKVLSEGAIATPMFAGKGPNMIASSSAPAGDASTVAAQYPAHFPLKHATKDLRFATNMSPPGAGTMTAAAVSIFNGACAAGLEDCDFAAVHHHIGQQKHAQRR